MAELAVEEISVRFGGLQALHDVNLEVHAGAVNGLIGPNGAGKTTLFNVITGLQPPTQGRVRLGGVDVTRVSPHQRARLGIARTFQRLELFGTLTARENVQMAAETRRRRSTGASSRTEADIILAHVGLSHVADEPTDLLPTGLARLVELGRALATGPSVLLVDEPSSGLNQEETVELGRVLVDLAHRGIAVLLVEHDMSLVMNICHYVSVLDYGAVIAHGDPASVQADPAVQAAYLGAAEEAPPPEQSSPVFVGSPGNAARPSTVGADKKMITFPRQPAVVSGPPMLSITDVSAAYGRIEVVHKVSLEVPEGSVYALLGPNGAGKSTLLKVASGRMPATTGTVSFDGEEIRRPVPDRLARRGLCAVPEGRAVFPNLTVAENLLMYSYRSRATKVSDLEEQSYARFPVLGERRRQLAGRLSGGEQQMLALARALFTNPRMLLLDEISMGLAPLVVAELYELVAQAVAQEGITILLVEQFAQTALAIADRAGVMVNGRMVRTGTPAEVGDHLLDTYMGEAG
ncbi:MAG TPA: ATP-binding cassette domain-containing protein [Acidimicrobiales bacterium]|nr:ATP-binding cassette domain-containing protein [Acidimicrobiales bacterium]